MQLIEDYIRGINDRIQQGDATEETFYGDVESFIEDVAEELGYNNIHVTPLPKRTEAGNPDFRIWKGKHQIVGYIESKNYDENLDKWETSDQLTRYRDTFDNLILMDFFEFRLFKDGDKTETARIGSGNESGDPIIKEDGFDDLKQLLDQFLSHSTPQIYQAPALARELAKKTRFMEGIIEEDLLDKQGSKQLKGFYEAFENYLISDLSKKDFADLYSQTITYGLFAARTRKPKDEVFNRQNAVNFVPDTIGILKDVFRFISMEDVPVNIQWIVEDISELLENTDISRILERYYEEGKGKDPIIHFYETFLEKYDPERREQRGVYYTPEPVVKYIVESIHEILKTEFDKPLGLADDEVTVLDPAAGTLTFIAEAFRVAVEEYVDTYGEGGKDQFIKNHLLKNFYGFELMVAPYAVGHLKMGFILDELGYQMDEDERFNLYLTNALDMEELEQTELPWMRSLSEESKAAGKVKKDERIWVVMGNPPYSGHSANNSQWIDDLLKQGYSFNDHKDDGYYKVNGHKLDEKNPKWLQDDYVKFIRFAQWKIDQHGKGVLGMITNHSYLDNHTFRGMRESLQKSFDKIHVLDLHGNSLKKETTPSGNLDDNVFNIRQGVAINLSFKKRRNNINSIKKANLYGKQEKKFNWLAKNSYQTTVWDTINPDNEFYFFVKEDVELRSLYKSYHPINKIFNKYSVGVVTSRDHFVIDFERNKLKNRIYDFLNSSETVEQIKQRFNLKDNRDWKVSEKRKAIQEDEEWATKFAKILYRPFDKREIFYHPDAIDFGREEVMKHMLVNDNIGLIVPKQFKEEPGCFVSDTIVGHKTVSAYDINYFFPMHVYKNLDKEGLFSTDEVGSPSTNLDDEFYSKLKGYLGKGISSKDVLNYIYGVIYAPTYRNTYEQFLKRNFPRVPFTTKVNLFQKISNYGSELINLHLMKSDSLNKPTVKFQGRGGNEVVRRKKDGRKYDSDNERMYINPAQYFEGITQEMYDYQIGGFQVLDKWIYDRRDRKLSHQEIQQYCKIATAIKYTMDVQEEIDELYPEVEKDVIE